MSCIDFGQCSIPDARKKIKIERTGIQVGEIDGCASINHENTLNYQSDFRNKKDV